MYVYIRFWNCARVIIFVTYVLDARFGEGERGVEDDSDEDVGECDEGEGDAEIPALE